MTLDESDKHVVRAMASVLRIAIGLDRSHDGRVRQVSVTKKNSKIEIVTKSRGDEDLGVNIYSARERSDLLCEVTGCTVEID